MLVLDHLAVAANSLDAGAAYVWDRLGIEMQPGGRHERFATHNLLIGLEDGLYLEVISIDPDATPPKDARWFNLDRFDGAPCLHNWICGCDDMSTVLPRMPKGSGRAVDLARGDLRWKMAVPESGALPYDDCCPALLQWQTEPPAARLVQSGARLTQLELCHPEAADLQTQLAPLIDDPRIRFTPATQSGLRACFDVEGELRWL